MSSRSTTSSLASVPAVLFFRNTRLLVLALALIAVGGLSALQVLPRMEDPRIVNRGAPIVTTFPGADAERVEALITRPLEDEILELDEVRETKSASRAGVSVIRVEMKDSVGFDAIDDAWARVRDKLRDAEPSLPDAASVPDIETDGFYAFSMLVSIAWESDEPPAVALLNRLGEELEATLREVPGTDFTEPHGMSRERVIVELNQERLAAMGLTAADVARQVTAGDAKVAAGTVRQAGRDVLVEVSGSVETVERLRGISIRRGEGGASVQLGDVAVITKAAEDPPTRLAISSGKRAVVIGARVAPEARVDQWAADARAAVEAFKGDLGPGLRATIIFDQSGYTEDRLSSLAKNFTLGVLAVIAVIVVLMGWRAAVLVGSALPLTALIVLAIMNALGVPIHQMSITGLIIALGLLIDNAIVIVDDLSAELSRGAKPIDAVRSSVSHLAVPLLGSTVTTVLAFAPIVLMPGGGGEFVGNIALVVILSLLTSFVMSMTVIAALAGRFESRAANPKPRGPIGHLIAVWNRGLSFPSLMPAYRSLLRGVVRWAPVSVAAALTLPVMGFYFGGTLVTQFFPGADRDQFQLQLRLPNGASIDATRQAVSRASEAIETRDRVTDIHWFLGDSAPTFYYNMTGGDEDSPHFAAALVQLDTDEDSRAEIRAIQTLLERELAGVQVLSLQLEQGPPFDAPVEVKIFGPDLSVLGTLGDQASAILLETPGVVGVRQTLRKGTPRLRVELDEDAARLAGLNNIAVAQQLDASLEGAFGGALLERTEELPVLVRLAEQDRADISAAASVDLFPPPGTRDGSNAAPSAEDAVPIAAVAAVAIEPSVSEIERVDGVRVNRVLGFLEAGTLPQTVLDVFAERLESQLAVPPGYSVEFGGEAGERDRAVSNLMASVAVLGVMMAATLVLSFASFRLAVLIGVVAIGAAGLGMLSLAVFGMPFGFMGIVGIMGLIGVAINDSIVVLSAIRADPQARLGHADAIANVVSGASRHVVATTLTTIAGFTPLLLDGGTFWPPMAVVIAGGVGGASLLALVLVPAAYTLLLGRWKPGTMLHAEASTRPLTGRPAPAG